MTASQLRLRPPPAVRSGWRRLCLSSFALAAITAGPGLLLMAGQLGEPFQACGR